MKYLLSISTLLLVLTGETQAADAHSGDHNTVSPETPCRAEAETPEKQHVTCALVASGMRQTFSFKANFTGGHDDTIASLQPTLNGAPLNCDEGSKTYLMGEYGEISLECKFSLNEPPGSHRSLDVIIAWSHAQYANFEFRAL